MNLLLVDYFEIFLLSVLVIFLFLTISQKNPVYSIIFLIFSFLIFSLFLLIVGVEFIALLFLVIYVGAISILFLFILMMLDVKYLVLENTKKFFFYGFCIGFSFFIILLFYFMKIRFFNIIIINFNYISWVEIFNYKSDIESLGLVLYNIHCIDFLLCGLVLLVSMIGSISLVINFNLSSKFQFLDKQVKSDNRNLVKKKSFRFFLKGMVPPL